jgi:hypothetical protein
MLDRTAGHVKSLDVSALDFAYEVFLKALTGYV